MNSKQPETIDELIKEYRLIGQTFSTNPAETRDIPWLKAAISAMVAEIIGENDCTSIRELSRDASLDEALNQSDANQERNFLRSEQRQRALAKGFDMKGGE